MGAAVTLDRPAERTVARSPSLRVVMVGPGLNVRGGVSNGQRLLIEAMPRDVALDHVASMVEGTKWRKFRTFVRAVYDIRKRLRGGEVVHIHFASGASSRRKMIIARLAMRRGASVIMHARGGGYREYWRDMSRAERTYTRRTLQRVQLVIVLGEEWRKFYVSIGVPPQKVIVVPNPVALPERAPERVERPDVRFVYFGLIVQRKGTFDLIEAIARLPAAVRSRVNFVIAGNGALAELRNLAARLGVTTNVDIRDWVAPQERDRLLASADAFVLPSYVEGLPNALLEAMAWSLPCICTPVGSICEYVRHGENGLMVRPGAVDELAEAISALALNPGLRARLGRAARTAVEPLDVNAYARKIRELYRAVAPAAPTA